MINKAKNGDDPKNSSQKLEFSILAANLLSRLPKRSQEIIKKRFGLEGEKNETLERIGNFYGITRERVRQIVTDAMKNISRDEENKDLIAAEDKLVFTIEKNNGIIKEKDIVESFNKDGNKEANAIKFLAGCSKKIQAIEEKGMFSRSWVLSGAIIDEVRKVNEAALEIFSQSKIPLEDEAIKEKISQKLPEIGKAKVLSFLKILVKVQRNKFGKWGAHNWTEINPKGTREKIYLILKEENRPLHFTEIANLIDKYKLGKKKAHPQTVHNELIKDSRFVLIGRGIYAMREWGYQEGTIKEVLKGILKESEKPLSKEEILEKVMKIRKVKKTTVMINLNNIKEFAKINDLYWLKK